MQNTHRPIWRNKNLIISAVVTLAIGMTGYVLVATHASGFFAASETEGGTLAGNASVTADASASGGKAVQFNAPAAGGGGTGGGGTGGSTGSCPLPAYPTPKCTGVPVGTSLTTINGTYEARTAGETINAKRITGDLIILANNVTITNSEIDGTIYNDQGSLHGSFTVTDSTIGPATGCIGQPAINDSNYTARRVLSRNHDDGFRIGPPGNVAVYDSYVQNCYLPPSQAPPDGSHSDGVQAVCGGTACANVTIVHNTFDGTKVPTTNMLNLTDTSLSNVKATDNLLAGGAYIIDSWWHSGATWTFTNNRLVDKSWAYGAVTAEDSCSHQTWSGNTLVTIDANYNITSTVGQQPCVQ